MSRGAVTVAAGYVGGGVLIFGSILTGHVLVAVVLMFAAFAAVLAGIATDARDEDRRTDALNRLAAEYGGLTKHDMARMRQGLEPVRKPAAGAPLTDGRVAGPLGVPLTPALCESCRREPAAELAVVDGRGFRVCPGCVPVTAFRDAGSSAVGVLVAGPIIVGGVVGLAWSLGRLGELAVPLKILACMAIALGVIGLAVVLLAVTVGGTVYALDRRDRRRALPSVTVQAVTADRAPDVLGQVVAGEVVREVTR